MWLWIDGASCAEGSKSRSKSAKPAKSPAQPSGTGTGNVTLAIRPSLGNEYFEGIYDRTALKEMYSINKCQLGAIFHPVSRPPARSASLGPERRMPKSVSSSTTGGNVGSLATKASPVKVRPAHNEGILPGSDDYFLHTGGDLTQSFGIY